MQHSQDIHGTTREYSYIQYSQNIISEYSPEFHWEFFRNILGISYGNVPQIFYEHIFARWVTPLDLVLKNAGSLYILTRDFGVDILLPVRFDQ